jgi:hypothetical protein
LQGGSYNGHLLCSKWSQLNVEITVDDAEHDLQQLGVRNWRLKARGGVEDSSEGSQGLTWTVVLVMMIMMMTDT